MQGLCGFLSPAGIYTECESWEHLCTAAEICENKYGKVFKHRLDAEDFLFEQGYVSFNARSCSHRWINKNKEILILTDKQVDFIIQNLSYANNDAQKEDLLSLLEWNEGYKESNLLYIKDSLEGGR